MDVLPDDLRTAHDTHWKSWSGASTRWNILPRHSISLPAPEPILPDAAQAGEARRLAQAGGMFSVLGKAMLGIAGAYLLRAVAESGSLPMLAVAAHRHCLRNPMACSGRRGFLPGHGLQALRMPAPRPLILAPMLWELTLSFKVLHGAR